MVAREVNDVAVFEIAHEALLGGWSTLSTWLEEERDGRAVRHRLELAVAEWERLGRGRDALWSGAPLQEVMGLDPASLRPKERDFIAACKAAARARALRRGAVVLLPAVAISMYGAMWFKGQADLRAQGRFAPDRGGAGAGGCRRGARRRRGAAGRALAAYDAASRPTPTCCGPATWRRLPRGGAAPGPLGAEARRTALSLDGRRDDMRERLGETLLLQRALLAEQARSRGVRDPRPARAPQALQTRAAR